MSTRSHFIATLVTVAAFAGALTLSHMAQAQECRGTKQPYQGKCRYPDEIKKLKAEEARQAEERRKEQQRQQDQAACKTARAAGTIVAWADYLASHPAGACRQEAARRIDELKAGATPAKPEPPPSTTAKPQPATAPDAKPPPSGSDPRPPTQPDTGEQSGLSPVAIVGFAVAGAGVLVGTITGIVHLTETSALEDECPNSVCPPDRQEDIDDTATIGHVSTVSFIVAGAGAAMGIIAAVLSDSGEPEQSGSIVRPLVGPGFLGLEGRF